jgi:hypothetical protein
MKNPFCVSHECFGAAIQPLLNVSLQKGQIHGMCHIFSILRELSYINSFPEWLSLETNGDCNAKS